MHFGFFVIFPIVVLWERLQTHIEVAFNIFSRLYFVCAILHLLTGAIFFSSVLPKLTIIYCILFAASTAQHKLVVIVFPRFFFHMCVAHSQYSHRFPCLFQWNPKEKWIWTQKKPGEKTIRHINKATKCKTQKNDCYKFYKCCYYSCFCSYRYFVFGWRHTIEIEAEKKW